MVKMLTVRGLSCRSGGTSSGMTLPSSAAWYGSMKPFCDQLVLGVGARDHDVGDVVLGLLLGDDLLAAFAAALVDALQLDAREALHERVADRVVQRGVADAVQHQLAFLLGAPRSTCRIAARARSPARRGGRRRRRRGWRRRPPGAAVGLRRGSGGGVGARGRRARRAAAGAVVGVAASGGLHAVRPTSDQRNQQTLAASIRPLLSLGLRN